MSKIEVLEEISHIRLRPGMYTVTDNPSHLITEIIDNALDELANKFANEIVINIDNQSSVFSVTDNGRGLPMHQVSLPDGTNGDSVVVACTKLFSGAKFNLNEYETSIGLHGVGLVVINALSNWMQVSIKDKEDNTLVHNYIFKDSKFIEYKEINTGNIVNWSTCVQFQINPKYFKSSIVPINDIKNRLSLVATKFSNSSIILNGETIPNLSWDKFFKNILEVENDEVKVENISYGNKAGNIELFFTYEDNSKLTPTIMGDVNLSICQGTYLSTISTLFYRVVSEIVNDNKLTKNDVLNQLRLYCSMTISEPEFEGQQKSRMTKDVGILVNKLYNSLKIKLDTFSFKERFKILLESKENNKSIKKIQKKGKRLSGDNPIKDCMKIPGQTLYLLEGTSAAGPMNEIRNRSNEAIMALTGKISNTINKDITQALGSDKMKYLLEAIGVGQKRYRYNKVKVLCDADADG